MVLNLADVLEALLGYRPEGVNLVITEASIDSRQCIAGSLFVAISGERVDGHNYVGDAFHKGAVIALVEKDLSNLFPTLKLDKVEKLAKVNIPNIPFCILVENSVLALQKIAKFWRSKLDLRVVGITGSVGKSTTKELISEVLNQKYRTLRNPGNLNNEIGLPLTILRLSEGYERAVLEMGFYVPGEIALLCDIAKPQVGVVTNIGTVHAERAGSQDVIARGKAELIKALPPAPEGIAILNYDDPRVRPMAELTRARVINYGLDPKADIWADEVVGEGLEGIRFNLHYQNDVFQLRVPLIGQHSVHTALRAAAVGLAEGLTWGEIIIGLRNSHSQLRLVAVYTEQGALLLDDTYNASPESTLAALNLLEELDGRKIAVLGDMLELGQYEEEGHELVGARAAEVVSDLITIGPRGKMIASSAMKSNLGSCCVHSFDTAMESIGYLQSTLTDGDVVLIKGSHSMHMDQIVFALEKER
jgi:UDP-N-acetylmuramoyl-tripeptide--D-alanyl-D-alanine ligase